MLTLALVPLIVWVGLFSYLVRVDRKVARVESAIRDDRK
jgi:CcmD family protein